MNRRLSTFEKALLSTFVLYAKNECIEKYTVFITVYKNRRFYQKSGQIFAKNLFFLNSVLLLCRVVKNFICR